MNFSLKQIQNHRETEQTVKRPPICSWTLITFSTVKFLELIVHMLQSMEYVETGENKEILCLTVELDIYDQFSVHVSSHIKRERDSPSYRPTSH